LEIYVAAGKFGAACFGRFGVLRIPGWSPSPFCEKFARFGSEWTIQAFPFMEIFALGGGFEVFCRNSDVANH
jgi:hypothetical protein